MHSSRRTIVRFMILAALLWTAGCGDTSPSANPATPAANAGTPSPGSSGGNAGSTPPAGTSGGATPGGGTNGGGGAFTGAFLYVANQGSGTISGFQVSSTGTAAPVSGSPFSFAATWIAGAGPQTIVAASGSTLTALHVDPATGALSAAGNTAVPLSVRSLAGDPSRGVVYAGTDNGLFGYRLSAGSFTAIPGTPIFTTTSTDETRQRTVGSLDLPRGGAVLAAGVYGFHSSALVAAIPVANDGALGAQAGIGADGAPLVAAQPSGQFIFDSDPSIAAISMLRVQGSALTSIAQLFVAAANDLAVSPDGNFLLATDDGSGGNRVHVYRIDAAAGTFTEVAGSPFSIGGAGGWRIAFDPSGAFVAVLNNLTFHATPPSQNVSVAAFNSATGVLTPLAGSPLAVGAQPSDVVVLRP